MAAEITECLRDERPSLFLTETFYGDFIVDTVVLVYYSLVWYWYGVP